MAYATVRTTPLRTLAIDPGTREMGYAVLEGTDLLYFGVHTFAHRRAAHQLRADGQRFVRRLMDTFAPQVFVIEKMRYAQSKRSARLPVVVEAMQRCARRQGLLVLTYAPATVKQMICGHGHATKREVAEALVRKHYGYLEKYRRTDLRTREMYWQNMFDAVALGLTGCEEGYKKQMALMEVRTQRQKIHA